MNIVWIWAYIHQVGSETWLHIKGKVAVKLSKQLFANTFKFMLS